MFPVDCFRQRTSVAQDHVNRAPNETGTHSCWSVRRMFKCIYIGGYKKIGNLALMKTLDLH